jgi:hypothetical protein
VQPIRRNAIGRSAMQSEESISAINQNKCNREKCNAIRRSAIERSAMQSEEVQ